MARLPALLLPSDGVQTGDVNLHGASKLDLPGVGGGTHVVQVLGSIVVGQRVLRGSVQEFGTWTCDISISGTHQLLVRKRSRLPSLCNQRRHVLVEYVRPPRSRLLRVDLFGRGGVFRVRGDVRPRSYEGEKYGGYPEDGEARPGARRIDVDGV
jgi:hypothetical protein